MMRQTDGKVNHLRSDHHTIIRPESLLTVIVCLFVYVFIKVGISTDKTVYLKRSYVKWKKKKRKKRRKVIRW